MTAQPDPRGFDLRSGRRRTDGPGPVSFRRHRGALGSPHRRRICHQRLPAATLHDLLACLHHHLLHRQPGDRTSPSPGGGGSQSKCASTPSTGAASSRSAHPGFPSPSIRGSTDTASARSSPFAGARGSFWAASTSTGDSYCPARCSSSALPQSTSSARIHGRSSAC